MSQKRPVNGFEWEENIHKFYEDLIKIYHEDSNKGYIFEVDVEYSKKMFNLHMNLPFLPERRKIERCNKVVCTTQNKMLCTYVVHIRALKEALHQGLLLKKLHRVIQFNQKA